MTKIAGHSDVILLARNVSMVYGQDDADASNRVRALVGASFTVRRGEFVLIVGASGSGKTTLLNMIGLLNTPSSGRIIIDGTDVTRLDSGAAAVFRSRRIGFVAQFSNLLDDLTILENVMLPRQIAGGKWAANPERIRRDAMSLLRAVGLEGQAHRRANKVSGGQAQRTAIARALANRPSIILADEPTGNLDSVTSRQVISLMKKTAKKLNQTFVIVTHDRDHFGDVDKVISVSDGKIMVEETNAGAGNNSGGDSNSTPTIHDNNNNNNTRAMAQRTVATPVAALQGRPK